MDPVSGNNVIHMHYTNYIQYILYGSSKLFT